MKLTSILMAGAMGATLAIASPIQSANANTAVGLELSLLVDVSGSIDASEYALQTQGYANAFLDPTVQAAIFANPTGAIAVNFIQWSGSAEQSQSVGWTLISNTAEANAFAAAILAAGRPFNGSTAPGSAINFAVPLFGSNAFDAPRQVIDVSGDGRENDGANTATARDNALAAGIDQINGLDILGEVGLHTFYQDNIVAGTGSFLLDVTGFATFDAGIKDKLTKEIKGEAPEPASIALFGVGLAGLGILRRKKA
jgi:hypothetical protein